MGVGKLERRAAVHHALGDVHRLQIVDALRLCDLSVSELRTTTGLSSNLLAFHLDVLEAAGLVTRQTSQGDRRRRYVTLAEDQLAVVEPDLGMTLDGPVLFVCNGNSARSQLAAALWAARTDGQALSAGTDPAPHVHRHAVEVARRHGLDLAAARPRGYEDVPTDPDLVVSVCDRVREAGLPFDAPWLHWSVPDPAHGDLGDFQATYAMLSRRIDRLALAVSGAHDPQT